MKKLSYLLIVIQILLYGCVETPKEVLQKGKLSFSVSEKDVVGVFSNKSTKSYEIGDVREIVLSIAHKGVPVPSFNPKRISVSGWPNGALVVEEIPFYSGEGYSLSSFELKNSEGLTIFATPAKNSPLAGKVDNALPYVFDVSAGVSTQLVVQVVSTKNYSPYDFGFAHIIVENVKIKKGVFVDLRDNKSYEWVKINNQKWFAENLLFEPTAAGGYLNYKEWGVTGVNNDNNNRWYSVYDSNYDNLSNNGYLYTWAAALNGDTSSDNVPSSVRGICPEGWHIPSDKEWGVLESVLGMGSDEISKVGDRGENQGFLLKSSAPWDGGDRFGFNGRPSGERNHGTGKSTSLGQKTTFWSSTESSVDYVFVRSLRSEFSGISKSSESKQMAYSIRCIED